MTTQEIDICCSKCHVVICSSNNEWRRVEDVLLITPVQKTCFKTIRLAKAQGFLPLKPAPEDLQYDIVPEATCAQCGSVLGQGCRDVVNGEPEGNSEVTYFVESAVVLRNSKTQEDVLPIVTDNVRKDILRLANPSSQDRVIHERSPTASSSVQNTSRERSQTLSAGQEVQTTLSRLTQQDVEIKKLYSNLESLQDRMLVLEKSMTSIRTRPRASSIDDLKDGQDMFIENFETMLGALKDARSAAITIEGLRSENKQLRQRLSYSAALTTSETQNEPPKSVVEMATGIPTTGAPDSAEKKRPYTRRKPLASRNSTTKAASGSVGPVSGFASNHDGDSASHIDNLTALNQIIAAIASAPSTSRAQSEASNQHFGNYRHEELVSVLSNVDYVSASGDDLLTTQPKKRRRTGDVIANGEEHKSTSRDQSHEPPKVEAESSTMQETRLQPPIVTQLQDAANLFNISSTDETMIDPALRSTSVPADQPLPAPAVLSSIQNPPAQRQPVHPAPQKKAAGGPQYDSDQERRIREYKARDALRKRKARAASTGKKKVVGEEKFKQEEKIRARDRMVRELMEREEMLENDGDL